MIPVLNDLRVRRLLDSLDRQTFPKGEFEVIVVDNAGNTRIGDIVRSFSSKYATKLVVEKRRSSYVARNTGMREASGNVVAFIDADCVAHRDWLTELVKPLRKTGVGGVGGRILKHAPSHWVERCTRDLAEGQLTLQRLAFCDLPFVVTANAAYELDLVKALGGFDERFVSGGDVDLAWRVVLSGFDLEIASSAIVYHSSRDSVSSYFRQYARYTTGQVLLFKKYAPILGLRAFFHVYPFNGFVQVAKRLPAALARAVHHRDHGWEEVGRLFLDFVMHSGILFGDLRGAVRHRVPYL